MRFVALLMVVSMAAAACGNDTGSPDAGGPGTVTATTPPSTSGTSVPTTVITSTSVLATTAGPATTGPATTGGATTTVPDQLVILRGGAFGEYEVGMATMEDTVAFVESFLGPPTRVRRLVEDEYITCPSGADTVVSWRDLLLLVFAADVLNGYLWEGASIPFATAEGVAINNSVSELEEAYPGIEVTETSLGYEWYLDDGLHGFVEGTEPDARITAIGGMDMCAFR